MTDAQTFTLEEAQLHFAKALNGEVWGLLKKADRSQDDNERMIHAAHASCYHWLHAGTGLNHQRGEWLIAHVYTELGLAEAALRHTSRCQQLTEKFSDQMQDFDRAYAFEAVARANALAGNREQALKYRRLAEEAGQAIKDPEDKTIFMEDLTVGNWYGLS